MDTTKIYPRIWLGSVPPMGKELSAAGFDTLVLCAEEFQPDATSFPGLKRVIHAPMGDNDDPTNFDLAVRAAEAVKREWSRNRNILVSCHMGRNRSAFVAALALFFITGQSMRDIVDHIRSSRRDPLGVRALQNPHFSQFLKSVGSTASL